jgi:phosphotransferase system HPr (HPr) family protein
MNGRLRQTVCITNPQGFHLRPLTAFVQLARTFQSAVLVSKKGQTVDGKNGWDMMAMLAEPGTQLSIEVDGPDAAAALDALTRAVNRQADPEPAGSPRA